MSGQPKKTTLLDWWLRYLKLGWPVFPLAPRSKMPLIPKERGGNGCKDATLDEAQVLRWYDQCPNANIGIATGLRFFVLDVDPKHNGDASLEELEEKHGKLPDTIQQVTGGGGRQFLFLMPDFPVQNSVQKLAPGLDIRGVGGYVAAPPSIHPETGRRYFWEGLELIEKQEILPAPAWLLTWLRNDLEGPKQPVAQQHARPIAEGGRNVAVFKFASSLRRQGFTAETMFPMLAVMNGQCCRPPLPDSELRTIAESAARYAPDARANVFSNAATVPPVAAELEPEVVDVALPLIMIGGRDLREEAQDCLAALHGANVPPELFIQSGRLFEIVRNERARQVGREVTDAALRGRLTRVADFRKTTAKGLVPCFPPRDDVEDLLSLPPGALAFPALDGIVNTPLIRDDGSILMDPGYDVHSKLFYSPDPGFKLPRIANCPSSDHIEVARALLDEMVEGFPFDGPSSKANYLAAILTPVLRPVIVGPTPMAAITAPAAGSGKSLLAEIVSIIATGEPAEMYSMPKDEEEMRKTLTTILASMAQVAVFDNVSRRMDSPDLAKALTETTHADRVFRTHQAMVLPVRCSWLVTGNNLRVGGDLHRRCYWIRLDAKTSRPELRNEFRIADLKAWVRSHRPMLLASLFTLARAWFAAGKPRPKLTPLGSFESWSITIAGILEHAGISGFLGNASEMREEADAEAGEWERFLQVLQETFGLRSFSVFDLYKKLIERTPNGFGTGSDLSGDADQLRRALPGYLSEVVDRNGFFQRRAGKLFAEHSERRFGESQIYIQRDGISHHAQMWGIRGGELRGVAGESGSC